ncbi:MAG: DUF1697 domain-containing protein [Planctomycetes bacterium]|nr:DUF1697 domain-containing protein [Planctomycetota bacterium]
MATYIALLRAVNVGGNILKMDALRGVCNKLGFENVRTYVQSGNVVFESGESASTCAAALMKALAGKTRLPVDVMVRTPAQLKTIIAKNPFLKKKGVEMARLAVAFLSGSAPKDAAKKLAAIPAGADEIHVAGTELYLHCPSGFARTKLTNAKIESMLSLRATTRNWNTVNQLYAMAGG